jgi:hypothetical protein
MRQNHKALFQIVFINFYQTRWKFECLTLSPVALATLLPSIRRGGNSNHYRSSSACDTTCLEACGKAYTNHVEPVSQRSSASANLLTNSLFGSGRFFTSGITSRCLLCLPLQSAPQGKRQVTHFGRKTLYFCYN